MADPFSIAAGAVGVASLAFQLLGGCIKGFVILSAACNLEKDAALYICTLNLQEIQLVDWAKRVGLLGDEGLLDRRINAKAVEETLLQLQTLLNDSGRLKRRYGLDIQMIVVDVLDEAGSAPSGCVNTGVALAQTRDLILARSKVAQGPNVLQRFRWATIDKDKMEKLVADIHLLVRELWNLYDPWRQDDIIASTQSIAESMVSLNERFDQLTSLDKALRMWQSHFPDHASVGSLQGLATSAVIKAHRIGLDQTSALPPSERDISAPSRYKLLSGLENLSIAKLGKLDAIDRSQTMGLSTYDGEVVFIEQKQLSAHLPENGMSRARSLAALLNLPKDQSFGSLICRGIVEDRDVAKFIFRHPYPGASGQQPRSLLDMFLAGHGINPPSLTKRIHLALQVARLVQSFHRAGWFHKSLRSENILFFAKTDGMALEDRLTEPILAGFAFSRPGLSTEASEQPSANPRHDIYRHPAALGEPLTSFSAETDIYSLGMILLEIAGWRPLHRLVDSIVNVKAEVVEPHLFSDLRSFLITGAGKGGTSRLAERMGDLYSSALHMCLKGKISPQDRQRQDEQYVSDGLLDNIVSALSECRV